MNKLLDGSCTEAATALQLSVWGTLALRLALMILSRIICVPSDRCLKVVMSSENVSIRVSRRLPSRSRRKQATECTAAPASGSTATTPNETNPPLPAVSYSEETPVSQSEIASLTAQSLR